MFRVKQRDSTDCAVAALLSIIRYYKGNISYDKLRYMMKCDKSGVSAYDLINTAKKVGFKAYGIKCNYEDINKLILPCIAHITLKKYYDHFIVIEKIGNKVLINDPYYGKRKYNRIDFEQIWNNIIIVLEPTKKLDKELNNNKYYINVLLSYKKELIILVVISLISIILSILGTYYFKALIETKNNVDNVFIAFSILIIIRFLIEFIRNKMMIHFDKTIDNDLMNNSFKNTLSLKEKYFINRQKGDVLSRLNNVENIRTLIFKIPFLFFMYLSIVIVCSYILFNISSFLFIRVVILILIYISIYMLYFKKNKQYIKRINEEKGYINGFLSESIDGITTIKSNGIEFNKNVEFNSKYSTYLDVNQRFNDLYNYENTIKNIMLFISFNYILYLGYKNLSISNLILFYSVLSMLIETIKSIFEMEEDYSNGIVAINRLDEIINNENDFGYSCNKINHINISNISYAYKNNDYIIDNLTFEINKGDRLIVKGKSGCGKTTLFQLILKYNDIDKGTIIIGNENIDKWNINSINKNISYASIDDKIFKGRLIENICFNEPNIIKVKELLLLTKLNKDIYSFIDEDANNISLGEKSKLLLCRALYKNSDVLIIDELLSNIGIEEENQILNNIIYKYKDKILIYTSHRTINESLFNKILNLKEREGNNEILE